MTSMSYSNRWKANSVGGYRSLLRTCALGKSCLSPCFSADELCIRAKISMPLDGHFDRFLTHFREALNEVGVEADKVEKVAKLFESRRNAVLNP